MLQVEKKIRSRVKRQMEKTQREYYLNEQLKAIQRELGNAGEEGEGDELAELAKKIERTKLSKEARGKAQSELKKLRAMAPMSAEATVSRNYLDVLLGLPWGKKSKLARHPGSRADPRRGPLWPGEGQGADRRISRGPGPHQQAEGPILCLVGRPASARPRSAARSRAPPGASSSASHWAGCATRPRSAATGAPISALPGKIVTNLKKAGASNPLFLLDEIDKLGQDFRGDPSSALLEVLDPEQNSKLPGPLSRDRLRPQRRHVRHHRELDGHAAALLDRMEIIRLEGYTEDEKVEIAKRHLIPKQIESHGLQEGELTLTRRWAARDDPPLHPGGRGTDARARDRQAVAQDAAPDPRGQAREGRGRARQSPTSSARKFRHGMSEEEDQIGAVTGLPGPRSAASCSASRPSPCPARARSRPPASSAR